MTTPPQKVDLARLGILYVTLDVHRKSEEAIKKARLMMTKRQMQHRLVVGKKRWWTR